jgi:histidinol-phosphatase (PHP family)
MMSYTNFHTHTYRCHHATGEVIDYAQAAFRQGSRVLGISDHVALPDNRWPEVRMPFDQLDHYEDAIDSARAAIPLMKIYKGMECEYDAIYHNYFEDELLGQRAYDYLIGAAHYAPLNGKWIFAFDKLGSAEALVAYGNYLALMMRTGLFAFIAHPDVFGCSNEDWNSDLEACSHDILQAAEETKTPLEINGNGFRKKLKPSKGGMRHPYPWAPFWEIARDYKINVICTSDAHRPEHVLANIDDGLVFAKRYQLKVIDTVVAAN